MTHSEADVEIVERCQRGVTVKLTRENHQLDFQASMSKLPISVGCREHFPSNTCGEFLLAAPRSGGVVFSFLLPLVTIRVSGRYVNSQAIHGCICRTRTSTGYANSTTIRRCSGDVEKMSRGSSLLQEANVVARFGSCVRSRESDRLRSDEVRCLRCYGVTHLIVAYPLFEKSAK